MPCPWPRPAIGAALCLALALAGCSKESKQVECFNSGKLLCGQDCIDIAINKANCGGCGLACNDPVGGSATCQNGRCVPSCSGNGQFCDANVGGAGAVQLVCADVTRDALNCGVAANAARPYPFIPIGAGGTEDGHHLLLTYVQGEGSTGYGIELPRVPYPPSPELLL